MKVVNIHFIFKYKYIILYSKFGSLVWSIIKPLDSGRRVHKASSNSAMPSPFFIASEWMYYCIKPRKSLEEAS